MALLWAAGPWREELRQLLVLLAAHADHRLHPLPWALPVPLPVHGHYSRAEIEAAYCFAEACGYGVLSTDAPWIHREGVLAHQPSACDLLFVTLRKSEALFSPTTRYRDLGLGPALHPPRGAGGKGAAVRTEAAQAGQHHRAVRVPAVRALRGP